MICSCWLTGGSKRARGFVASAICAVLLSACGGGGSNVPGGATRPTPAPSARPTPTASGRPTPTPTPSPTPFPSPPAGKISHVVIVIQENRSFDNLFQGYPGANTASSGYTSNGTLVKLQPVSLAAKYDMYHQFINALDDINGGLMNGFDTEAGDCGPSCPPNPAYSYVPASETQPYYSMAGQYVLADDFFPSDEDGSFVSHQYLIAAQAMQTYGIPANLPWGCDGDSTVLLLNAQTIPGTPTNQTTSSCFTGEPTLAGEIDQHPNLSWRFYSAPYADVGYAWNAFTSISQVRNGPEWGTNIVTPSSQFLTDVAAGKLASVTWITPNLADSDHPNSGSTRGPQWVTSVVDAVGESSFWPTTAIFVLWDDWGGWYDHVPPAVLDYDGLGIRTPLIVISPYAFAGRVAHTQYEFGSILGFTEDVFGLAHLNASDARANPLTGGDVFNFSQQPRAFTPFLRRRPAAR